jgi:hypothetical protein
LEENNEDSAIEETWSSFYRGRFLEEKGINIPFIQKELALIGIALKDWG